MDDSGASDGFTCWSSRIHYDLYGAASRIMKKGVFDFDG